MVIVAQEGFEEMCTHTHPNAHKHAAPSKDVHECPHTVSKHKNTQVYNNHLTHTHVSFQNNTGCLFFFFGGEMPLSVQAMFEGEKRENNGPNSANSSNCQHQTNRSVGHLVRN